jgi:D-lyxose ketol-isomerase
MTMKKLMMAVMMLTAVTAMAAGPRLPRFTNAQFYDAKGTFLVEKAKDAYITLMKFHGYPVFPGLREKLGATDFGTGKFVECGLGFIMHKNNEQDRYMLMDLFLLQKQMLPEHWHEATDKNPVKLEGWLVRHGMSHIVGEGDPNLAADVIIPQCHAGGTATVKHEVLASPGEFVSLNRAGAHHWQYGGPEGAIITEAANVHDDNGVRILDKKMDDAYHGKK